jgi:acyl transferase domain-containing protein/NAD(P)H-dependent flavin oxidoreductase YrpB (nitropropane dioxygenase family)/NAD(P)-dependent dehydrogenase (short-subunit alcohol dehydrogenase family)
MEETDLKNRICIVTPFEAPDVALALSTAQSGAFPVLHLGRDHTKAQEALNDVAQKVEDFGVCLVDKDMTSLALPKQVSAIMLPWGFAKPKGTKAELVWQVHSVTEAKEAIAKKAKTLVLKGAEGSGICGKESSFLLFQQLAEPCKKAKVALYVQGGVGVRSSAAYLALGAAGVVLDSQVALMPECSASAELKTSIGRLNGSEIRSCENYRYLLRPGASDPGDDATMSDILPRLGTTEEFDCLPLGQDAILASDFAESYRRIKHLIKAIEQAAFSQVSLVQTRDVITRGDAMSEYLGTKYPLAQGPMARISDVPQFLRDVADGGALPFLAMSMMVGTTAEKALSDTAEALKDKPWGVGILGFAFPKMLEEQTRLICETKPPFVLIAGGRPSLAKPFEQAGIKVFLHTPAAALLDMFLKEGSRSFIFEGRESGGHVGPLFSTVLWEKQMYRLLAQENIASLNVFFAGGIHDEFSAAFVRIMVAPLVTRDARAGIIAGTAYLYTDEIVKSGAITKEYQRQLIKGTETVLLKSGKGQETCAVFSPYTKFFADERKRMLDEGEDNIQVLMKLEELNIGRLRIASKGIERIGDEYVSLPLKEQRQKGLYMTGSLTPQLNETISIADLHAQLMEKSSAFINTLNPPEGIRDAKTFAMVPDTTAVAVIGMAGIFPDASDIDEYWRNILFGKDSIIEVPKERWDADLFYDGDSRDTDHVVSKWGGFLSTADFDALEFGITPQSLSAIEPVQLLSLLVTKRAFENAGYTDLSAVDLDETSVIFGAQGAGELATGYGSRAGLRGLFGELTEEMSTTLPRLTEDSFPGVLSNVIAGRISNRLNTGGRNFTVDAACASSLAALDIAMAELTSGRSKMVVLGGADVHNSISDFLMFSSTYALSRRGYCASFDAEADGITLGEGVGVLILKRLEDAKRDGDTIHAVIRGVGGSSDGKQLGLTAPSKRGQVRALEQAYASTGIRPCEVGLIEAHGTGTVVGDRIELKALTDVFLDAGTVPHRTQLGSVKTQIGHTKCAAGAASLIKAVLCVKHGLRPATLNLKQPNDAYARKGPFFFRAEKTGLWSEDKRIAGISGFGFGGTNFHALLENYTPKCPDVPLKAWPSELVVFRGKTPEEAREVMTKIVTLCDVNNRFVIKDLALSLAFYNADKPIQYSIVAKSTADLLEHIDAVLHEQKDEKVFVRKELEGKVAFLFPGQGSQRVDMAADLFVLFPQMRRLLAAHPKYEDILFPPTAFSPEEKKAQRAAITDTRAAQPLLGLVDLGIAELLRNFGVAADMLCGHSYGELPALCFAKALDADDLLDISRRRAEAILDAVGDDAGRMIAVSTDSKTLETLLENETDVWAVNLNAPRQTVVAGTSEAIEAFGAKLKKADVAFSELNVACAFHSPLLSKAEGLFEKALKDIKLRKPCLSVWSNTTARPYPQTPAAIKKRLAEHLVNPVRFTDEIEKMYEDGARIFIEVGPGAVLTGLVDKNLKDKEAVLIQTEQKDTEGLSWLLEGLARYLTTGKELDFERLFDGRSATIVDIDEPEQYRKRGTVWNIDGRRALPDVGDPPAHAGKLVTGDPLALRSLDFAGLNASPEQIMMAYLDNMNSVIQDQRDVMLGYFGEDGSMPRAQRAPRQFTLASGESSDQALATVAEVSDVEDEEVEEELPSILDLDSEEIMDIILKVVSEKTGYPIEMLDFEANLEADLSIDSIKKMEIVGGLREYATFPENLEDMEESFEKLISIKTLQELHDWIVSLEDTLAERAADEDGGFKGAQAVIDIQPTAEALDSTTINRLVLSYIKALMPQTDQDIIKDAHFAITDDGDGLAGAIADELKQRGAQASVISADTTELSEYDGIVLINVASAKNHYTTIDFLKLLKQADINKLRWIYSFDDAIGTLLEKGLDAQGLELLEGFSGFIKTLKHEYSDKRLCAINFHTPIETESFATLVADELCIAEPFPEIFYRGQERLRLTPAVEELSDEDKERSFGLDENSHILVLGGAQGITAPLLVRLANIYPCHYILLGRSEQTLEKEEYAKLTNLEEIRAYLIETEEMKQPGKIEQKAKAILKTNQIRQALENIKEAGAQASYRSVDVRDSEAFSALVAELKETYGSIDGVIHAAGILEDKLFRNKEVDSFERVYGTKVDPLKVIVKDMLDDLKLFVMFSSVTSTLGNPGQCDYAAGNTVMDSVAQILSYQRPELRTLAFNWGPWKGAGMVNEGLELAFRKRGVSFLRLDEGGTFFVDEITRGDKHNVVAMAGDRQKLEEMLGVITNSEEIIG